MSTITEPTAERLAANPYVGKTTVQLRPFAGMGTFREDRPEQLAAAQAAWDDAEAWRLAWAKQQSAREQRYAAERRSAERANVEAIVRSDYFRASAATEESWQRNRERLRRKRDDARQGTHRCRRRHPHRAPQWREIGAAAARHLARCFPFEQTPVREQQAPRRTQNRIEAEVRLERQPRQGQSGLDETAKRRACSRRDVLSERNFRGFAKKLNRRRE